MAQIETTTPVQSASDLRTTTTARSFPGARGERRGWISNAVVLVSLLLGGWLAYQLPAVTLTDGSDEGLSSLSDRITMAGNGWVIALSWFGVLVGCLGAVFFPRSERFIQTILITFAALIAMSVPIYVAPRLDNLGAESLGTGLIVPWALFAVAAAMPWVNVLAIDRTDPLFGRDWTKWLFLLPAAIWIFALTLFPLVYAFSTSRYSYRFGTVNQPVGWENYQDLFEIGDGGQAILGLLGVVAVTAGIVMLAGSAIHYLSERELGRANLRAIAGNIPIIAVPAAIVYLTGTILEEDLGRQLMITFYFVAGSVSVEMILGICLALLMNREIKGRGLIRATLTLPIFATPIAMGYLARALFYEEGGPINAGLTTLGFDGIPWLSDPTWAKISTVVVDVWQWTPFVFIIALAGLQGLPQDILEAAEVDGSSSWQSLRHIVLPMLAPILWLIFLLRAIDAFKVIEIPQGLTLGGPGQETKYFSMYIYESARKFFDYGEAAAMAFLLLGIVIVMVTLIWGRIKHIYEDEGVRA